ncbi:DUF2142 domain-containing protein [Frankia sp. Ag45/Mut15]|uniref:DUF2142 domain-containing protein n=1 Tax=Frankia umida TaxID=573489 RepID=A0ABT0JUM9_9ACTN|nr:DUF2142 domain-containing protein [Frankia umida]MCK9875224.1 DUF2142 domain-containing protein [Frankia umida]
MVLALLMAGFSLLLSAWVGSNAPGFGPDEPANFIKEVGAGTGQWTGVAGRLAHPAFGDQPGAPERIAWINRNSRVFELPAGVDPGVAHFSCDLFHNDRSVRCLDRPATRAPATRALSYVGTYEPYVYAVPGAAMARTHTARAALYTGRAVTAALVALLLAVALVAAWDRRAGPVSLSGVLLAASPMVLFLGSVLGTNGLEIAGTLALCSLALRMGRAGAAPLWTWPAAGLVGALVALSRPTGPAWVLLAAVVGGVLAAGRPQHRAGRHTRPAVGWAAAWPVLWRSLALAPAAMGIVATLLWERAVQPHPGIHRPVVVEGLHRLGFDAQAWVRQWVGVFGWASLPMPDFAYWLWWVGALVLVGLAVALGSRRTRVGLALVLVGAAAVAVGLDVLVLRQTRFPVYGRYLLPLALLVPLVAGEIVTRRADRLAPWARQTLRIAVPSLVTAVHLVALWANGRRYAVGVNGPRWYFDSAQWTPPGGWSLWGALAGAGAACILGAVLAGSLTGRSPHTSSTGPSTDALTDRPTAPGGPATAPDPIG